MRRLTGGHAGPRPLSKPAFLVGRMLAFLLIAATTGLVVLTWAYWDRLGWPYRVVVALISILLTAGWDDLRSLFLSYDRYLRRFGDDGGRDKPDRGNFGA